MYENDSDHEENKAQIKFVLTILGIMMGIILWCASYLAPTMFK